MAQVSEEGRIKYGELEDEVFNQKRGAFILCEVCGAQTSAHAGDYWNMPKDAYMVCGQCGNDAEMYRVVKQVTYKAV